MCDWLCARGKLCASDPGMEKQKYTYFQVVVGVVWAFSMGVINMVGALKAQFSVSILNI